MKLNEVEILATYVQVTSLSPSDCSHYLADSNDNQTQKCMLGDTLGEHVFRIDWIREEILKYAIYDNTKNISRKLLKIMRLVQQSWLSSTTKLLKKCGDPPLIQLKLEPNDHFYGAQDIDTKKKLLDQFNATFGASTRLKESFLPFNLKLGSVFFREENYQSLSDCFTRIGKELVGLEIIYPLVGGNMPVNFQRLCFPNLRKLSFKFSLYFPPSFKEPPKFPDNKLGLWLLQSVLNAAGNLQELAFPYVPIDVVPFTFEFLHLPSTIVSLELEVKLDSEQLETFFQRNQLPNLNNLLLQLHGNPLENGVMYKILEQFQKTLTTFQVGGICNSGGSPYPRTFLRFPKMEKLESITILSTECELDAEQLTSLQEYLPKLERVSLQHQTEAMLKKWVDNSKFEGVYDLFVSNINELLSAEHDNYYRTPSPEILTKISLTFPNVKELLLHLNVGFLNVLNLERVFLNMNKVEKLELNFHGRFQRNSSDLLDSVLTGIPISLVGALKENRVDISS